MNRTGIIACDPGKTGGFAYIDSSDLLRTHPMPEDPREVVALLRSWAGFDGRTLVIERVGGFVGGKGNTGSSMFVFGENVGMVVGVAVALGYRLERVQPQKWIKAHSLGTRGELTKPEWKKKLATKARELYPHCDTITPKTADAVLILDAYIHGKV